MLLLLLQACGIENLLNGTEVDSGTDPTDQSQEVQQAISCVYTDHSVLIPESADDDGNLSAEALANEAQELADIQQDIQSGTTSVLTHSGLTESQLRSGEVPAHLVVKADQSDAFAEDGDYSYLLVLGSDTETLQSYSGPNLADMANELSLDAIYARADVHYGSTSSQNFECGVFSEGNSVGEIDTLLTIDSTGAGTIYTSDSLQIPLYDSDTRTIFDHIYASDFEIADTTTDALGVTLDTPDVHSDIQVFELNSHLK